MLEDPKFIRRGMHYIMVARYLERCADHACKMAEKIIYMVTGKHVDIEGKGDVQQCNCVPDGDREAKL